MYVCNISQLLVWVQAEPEETFDWTHTHTQNSEMDSKSVRLWEADYDCKLSNSMDLGPLYTPVVPQLGIFPALYETHWVIGALAKAAACT